jgi:hypothetical protein
VKFQMVPQKLQCLLGGMHTLKENWVRLNTDGSSKDNAKAGCGGLIRGSDGEWLGGFSKFIENCS